MPSRMQTLTKVWSSGASASRGGSVPAHAWCAWTRVLLTRSLPKWSPSGSRVDTSQYTHPVGTVAGSGCPLACTSSSRSASNQSAISSRVDGRSRAAERGSAAHASDALAASGRGKGCSSSTSRSRCSRTAASERVTLYSCHSHPLPPKRSPFERQPSCTRATKEMRRGFSAEPSPTVLRSVVGSAQSAASSFSSESWSRFSSRGSDTSSVTGPSHTPSSGTETAPCTDTSPSPSASKSVLTSRAVSSDSASCTSGARHHSTGAGGGGGVGGGSQSPVSQSNADGSSPFTILSSGPLVRAAMASGET
mmetsp:Transcript_27010/g.86689  ORF Transcript_27010/g.86689 Transcript_27010/m.86689 type:complete len:307 (+) Transcript_27010:2173-3093(+)